MNLLITTIGKYNHFKKWTDGKVNFDVALIEYEDTLTLEQRSFCVYSSSYPTFKMPGIYRMFRDEPKLRDYDYFWMPDEDIELSTKEINKLFDKMIEYDLDLAQPSIEKSTTSFPSWRFFIHSGKQDIYYINFIEVMCPVFSRMALIKCLDTFNKSQSGWGLDIIWPKLVNSNSILNAGRNIAVIDCVVAKHTRLSQQGPLYPALREKNINPDNEMRSVLLEYGMTIKDIKKLGRKYLQ
jgi:hypothetical protein